MRRSIAARAGLQAGDRRSREPRAQAGRVPAAGVRQRSRANAGLATDRALQSKVAFLSDPRHFAGHPRTVEVIETHFAWVFLAGARAFKLKKPMRQASMDYRTLAARESACRAELRLNRRLAPGVYRRVVALRRTRAGNFSRRAGVRTVDWLVEMRRLPAARSLDRLLAQRAVRGRDLQRLLRRLTAFFRQAERRPLSDRAYLARLRRQIVHNAHELGAADLALNSRQVARLARSQLRLLAEHAAVFTGRGAHLVDGHGDLRPEHVFLGACASGACVIDCLEFDRDLRRLDPAEEIAFLALECTRLSAPRVAARLVAGYRSLSGDRVSRALSEFYMSRRAAVRAQISAWHLRDEAYAAERRAWRARACSYLSDALRLSRRAAASARLAGKTAPGDVPVIRRRAPASPRAAAPRAHPRASGARARRTAARPAA